MATPIVLFSSYDNLTKYYTHFSDEETEIREIKQLALGYSVERVAMLILKPRSLEWQSLISAR